METIETPPTQIESRPAKIPVPNSTAVLVLGIFSIVTSWCCGFVAFVGLILGIVALTMSNKAQIMYQEEPGRYLENSYKNLNAGRVCAIIGIVISGLLILGGLIALLFLGASIGTLFSTIPWENIIN